MTHASRAESASASVDERSARTFEGLRNLVAKVTPWLIDVGSWIFGGLTAINLVVMSRYLDAWFDALGITRNVELCGRKTAQLVLHSTLRVYENAAHGLFVTHADQLNADVLAFAGAHRSRAPATAGA